LYGALRAGVLTTPDTLSVHALLAEIADAGAEHAVMEVSSHGLAQGRVAAVEFNVGVFTNLSRDHLDFHADMHEYGEAKRQLFAVPTLSAAVVNADDEFGRELIRRMPETVQTFAYGLQFDPRELGEKVTPVCGRVVAAHRYSLTLEVNSSGVQAEFSAPLLGRFNALNLLAALGSLLACGVSLDVAAVALRNVPPVPGRMESFGGTDTEPLVVVDYSHTPDSLRTALGALREQSTGRLWCVFGCGGDRDTGKRAQMAAAAAELSDQMIITDDNPRTEDGDQIVADIVLGVPEQTEFQIVRDRLQAITQAVQSAAPRDTVLVAGKGHEPYQEINGLRRPFSDTASVRLALRGRHS
jgi:UDP-N-acetylmuramoyl-L-alanyl-D-glutamate--2,6-diaminopimelate ligase